MVSSTTSTLRIRNLRKAQNLAVVVRHHPTNPKPSLSSCEPDNRERISKMARSALLHLLRTQSNRHLSSGNLWCRSLASPHTWSSRPSFNTATKFSASNRRWLSQIPAAEEENKISIGPRRGVERGEDEKDNSIVYYGPISSTIKKVKLLSLSTCCLSVSLGPVITFMTSPEMNVILKGAVASSVIFLSASTTAALHWFVNPYVHKLKWQPGSDSFEVEMMSWLATHIPRTIKFSDIRLPETNRPFVTFKANNDFYFIDEKHCHNKALLARLTPQKPPVHESAFKNL